MLPMEAGRVDERDFRTEMVAIQLPGKVNQT